MLDTDFCVVYSGNGAGTITLPAANAGAISSNTNYQGRVYYIKNTTQNRALTVTTQNSSESIDGSRTVSISPGQSVQLVSTGLPNGATWEIISYNFATTAGLNLGPAIYLKATTNTNATGTVVTPLNLNSVVYNSGDFTYNTTTDIITVNRAGTYIANLQVSFTGPNATTVLPAGTQLLGGITAVSTGNWIGRGSHYSSTDVSGTIGELLYVSSPVTLTAGQQVRFAVAPSNNATVLANETGATGTGVVTTALLQLISQ
jgi:plastocyanin